MASDTPAFHGFNFLYGEWTDRRTEKIYLPTFGRVAGGKADVGVIVGAVERESVDIITIIWSYW